MTRQSNGLRFPRTPFIPVLAATGRVLGLQRHSRFVYLRSYVLSVAAASVLWESGHMPLYTLWETATPGELARDVLICTGVNIVIATASLAVGLLLASRVTRRAHALATTLAATCAVGIGYTIYSEWVNVYVKGTWAYSGIMPILPGLEVGLSPLVQWIVLPSVGILVAERTLKRVI